MNVSAKNLAMILSAPFSARPGKCESTVVETPDPRVLTLGLLMARELSDPVTEARLSDLAEQKFQPLFFGEAKDRFGWWFNLGEQYPRGQLSALMMVSEEVYRHPKLGWVMGRRGLVERLIYFPGPSAVHAAIPF